MDFRKSAVAPLEQVNFSWEGEQLRFSVLREDCIHPAVSGNKWRKLKYHFLDLDTAHHRRIVTFGGAYSNHIAATAAACEAYKLEALGIIRGEEPSKLSHTLIQAAALGMKFRFVSREEYRDGKEQITEAYKRRGDYVIAEGGADKVGVQGCSEILDSTHDSFSHIAVSAGTGTTAAGMLQVLKAHQELLIYPALKGDFIKGEISKWVEPKRLNHLSISDEYHFGGYAKTPNALLKFIQEFYRQTKLKLDPIYTAKLAFGLLSDMKLGKVPKDYSVLMIHTGGLQGVEGIEKREGLILFPD